MRKELEKIKKTESPPEVIRNLYSKEEIKEFLKLYADLPTTVHNKKQNVIKKRWLQGYNEKLEKIFYERLKKQIGDFKYHFVFVGRRSYQKGFDHCLEISKCFPKINFLWVGAREKNQFIQEEIPKNLTLSDYMDQDEIFNSSRYIICTSRWEGCSTIISECVISIKPFISLYCDGVTEFKVKNINEKNFFKKIEYMKEFIVENNYDEQKVIAGELYRHFYEDLNVSKNIKKLYEYTESYIANR